MISGLNVGTSNRWTQMIPWRVSRARHFGHASSLEERPGAHNNGRSCRFVHGRAELTRRAGFADPQENLPVGFDRKRPREVGEVLKNNGAGRCSGTVLCGVAY